MRFIIITLVIIIGLDSPSKTQNIQENYFNRACDFTETRQYQKAIAVCDELILIEQGNANYYYLRGVNYFFLQDWDKAIVDFDQTLKLNPQYTDAYLKRAKAKNKNNNFVGALVDYNNARNESFYKTLITVSGDFFRSMFTTNDK
jgi:tetratricopeptide (TPR) repeat protein